MYTHLTELRELLTNPLDALLESGQKQAPVKRKPVAQKKLPIEEPPVAPPAPDPIPPAPEPEPEIVFSQMELLTKSHYARKLVGNLGLRASSSAKLATLPPKELLRFISLMEEALELTKGI